MTALGFIITVSLLVSDPIPKSPPLSLPKQRSGNMLKKMQELSKTSGIFGLFCMACCICLEITIGERIEGMSVLEVRDDFSTILVREKLL